MPVMGWAGLARLHQTGETWRVEAAPAQRGNQFCFRLEPAATVILSHYGAVFILKGFAENNHPESNLI